MKVSDTDLNKIRGVIEETINGEVYFKKIKGVVEEAISGEANKQVIKGVVEEAISGEANKQVIKGVVEEAIGSEKYLKKIEKLIVVGVGEALEQVVFPKLDEIERKMATKEDVDKLGRRIRNLEDEVGVEPRERLTL